MSEKKLEKKITTLIPSTNKTHKNSIDPKPVPKKPDQTTGKQDSNNNKKGKN